MKLVIGPDGKITTLANEDVDWLNVIADQVEKRRASHVEPVNLLLRMIFRLIRWSSRESGGLSEWTRRWLVQWRVNLGPSGGPIVQSFTNRADAILYEVDWLLEHRYGINRMQAIKLAFGYGAGKQKLKDMLEGK